VLRPAVVAELAGARDGVENPGPLAGFRVVRRDAAAPPHDAADARDDEAVVVERGARDAVALLPRRDDLRPDHLARALVERDEVRVELADEHLAFAERDAAVRAAERITGAPVHVRAVLPKDLARVEVERRVALIRDRATVGDPFVARQRAQTLGVEGGGDGLCRSGPRHGDECGDECADDGCAL
jgi:hypothetical protein